MRGAVQPENKRLFCFNIVIWGERHRNFFLDYCLPSLLAPGNLPALDRRHPAKFLFATTSEDWAVMRDTAIFHELERHIEPVLVELLPCPPERPYWLHNIVANKLLCDRIFHDRAFRILIGPDAVYSDGYIKRLQDLALQGAEVVLGSTTRFAEEPFFHALTDAGLLSGARCCDTGAALRLSPRQLVAAALKSMHSQTVVNEWEAPYFGSYAAVPWWRVPDGDGIIMRSMYWDLMLADYGAITQHDAAILDDRGFDGEYFARNFGKLDKIYAIRDSDEGCLVSWTPVDFAAVPLTRQRLGELGKGIGFRRSFYGPRYDDLKRRLFFVPLRFHAGPLGTSWDTVEQKSLEVLLTWLDAPHDLVALGRGFPPAAREYEAIEAAIARSRLPWWRRNRRTWAFCEAQLIPLAERLMVLPAALYLRRYVIMRRLLRAAQGEPAARRWLAWRFTVLLLKLAGRTEFPPMPDRVD